MEESFNEIESIKQLFEIVLGSKVKINDNIKATEATVFDILLNKVEESLDIEDKLYEIGNIDISKVTDPLWMVLENQFKLIYGEDATELIMWYLMERLDDDGNVTPLVDENEKEIMINNPTDLWNYIKNNIHNEGLEK